MTIYDISVELAPDSVLFYLFIFKFHVLFLFDRGITRGDFHNQIITMIARQVTH